MFNYQFKCDKCGCEDGKIVLVDGEVWVVCENEGCLTWESLDYTRWN